MVKKRLNLVCPKGMGKDELLEKTNSVLGLNNINLNIPKAKDPSCYGIIRFWKINPYKTFKQVD